MAKKLRLHAGDVFTIPLGNGQFGFGQIVCFPKTKDSFIMAVYDYVSLSKEKIEIKEICSSKILFLGYSTDARIFHNIWDILGNYTVNLPEIVLPYFKLGSLPNEVFLVDHKGKRLVEIDELNFIKLEYETHFAPIRFENALKAYYGLLEWNENDFGRLSYDKVRLSSQIAEQILSAGESPPDSPSLTTR